MKIKQRDITDCGAASSFPDSTICFYEQKRNKCSWYGRSSRKTGFYCEKRKKKKNSNYNCTQIKPVMKADKIIVLSEGKIIEEGDHEKLIAKRGAYYSFWEKQFPGMKLI